MAYTSVDSVGGDEFEKVMSATRNGGTTIVYGVLSGKPNKANALDFLYNLKRAEVCLWTQGYLLIYHSSSPFRGDPCTTLE